MKSKKEKIKITKNSLIAEVISEYPELIEVLTEDYNFHCVGCSMAAMETLEEGGMVHGMTKKEVTEMVSTLNQLVIRENKSQK
jgi:hybrid cluster-associated redox disulfide protein